MGSAFLQFLIYLPNPPAYGLHHIHGDGVPSLLICLGVRGDGKDAVDHVLREALQAETFTGHEAADTATEYHALVTSRHNSVGDVFRCV